MLASRQNMKNMQEIEYSIQDNAKAIQKNMRAHKSYEDEIIKLRNQLSEYKLKKEAKLNKLVHNNSMTQSQMGSVGGSSDNYDYVVEKLQFLLKHVKELMSKGQFQEERDTMQTTIDVLRRKIGESVSGQYHAEAIKNMEVKILTMVSKYIKAHSGRSKGDKDMEQDQLEKVIEDGNREFQEKVGLHQQKIQDLSELIEQLRGEVDLQRKEKLKSELQLV